MNRKVFLTLTHLSGASAAVFLQPGSSDVVDNRVPWPRLQASIIFLPLGPLVGRLVKTADW